MQLQEEEYKILINQAFVEAQTGDLQKAWQCVQAAYDHGCKFGQMHVAFGAVYEQMQAFDKAYAAYHHAIQVDPDLAQAYNNQGRIALMIGWFDEAMDDFRKAIALQPDNARAHYNLGSILEQRNQVSEALKEFQAAAAMGYAPATEAVQKIQKQLQRSPSDIKQKPQINRQSSEMRLQSAQFELAKFAYARMGPHQSLQMTTVKRMFGLGAKQQLVPKCLWHTKSENTAIFREQVQRPIAQTFATLEISPPEQGYVRWTINKPGSRLEMNQHSYLLIRVSLSGSETYEVSIWHEFFINNTRESLIGQSQSYTVAASELERVLHGFVEQNILKQQSGTLICPLTADPNLGWGKR